MPRALIHFPESTRPGAAAAAAAAALDDASDAVASGASYTHAAALRAARKTLEAEGWKVVDGRQSANAAQAEDEAGVDLYFTDYDIIPFEQLLPSGASADKPTAQCSSYVIRKALIRKHHLAHTLHLYSAKERDRLADDAESSGSAKGKGRAKQQRTAQDCTPRTWHFELQYADELDELLMDELYDLGLLLSPGDAAEEKEEEEQPVSASSGFSTSASRWFILKPGMADRGHGIRLFNSIDMLREIFEELEQEADDSDDDDGDDDGARQDDDDDEEEDGDGDGMLSQLRHFVIQVSTSLSDGWNLALRWSVLTNTPHA